MAEEIMPIQALIGKLEQANGFDFLKETMRATLQAIMEEDVKRMTGLGLHERGEDRSNHRNGYRDRDWNTRVGTIPLKIPRTRSGSYFPPFLEPRKRSEQALFLVVQQAYVSGVSTRKVDDLVQAMGLERMDKSQVSRICKALDEQVQAFRNRPIENDIVYLWLDATYLKVRENGRVVSMAVVVAVGVNTDGAREILGFDVGPAESHAFWKEFLRGLTKRGLKGLRLVISDAHEGLKQAITSVFAGASWQRCRVHFMRNVLSRVQKGNQAMVSATVRTIFMQPGHDQAVDLLGEVAQKFQSKFPRVAELLIEAQDEVLAFYAFPSEHWGKIYSTNPLERLNKEIKRRSDVVGIFPDRDSVIRLVGALLMEQNDEWAIATRYMPQRTIRKLTQAEDELEEASHFPDQRGILAQK